MQAIAAGRFPPAPIQDTIGFTLEAVEEGRATFRLQPDHKLDNPMGTVHGGVAMTLLDSAMGCAVHTTLARGQHYGTLEVKVNLVRPITADTGPLLAHGEVVHRGSRVATAEARLVGEADGKLYAHGSSTCMILGEAA